MKLEIHITFKVLDKVHHLTTLCRFCTLICYKTCALKILCSFKSVFKLFIHHFVINLLCMLKTNNNCFKRVVMFLQICYFKLSIPLTTIVLRQDQAIIIIMASLSRYQRKGKLPIQMCFWANLMHEMTRTPCFDIITIFKPHANHSLKHKHPVHCKIKLTKTQILLCRYRNLI